MSSSPFLERRLLLRSRRNSGTPALFLDRDGVLIDDVHYLSDPNGVQVLKGADTLLEVAALQGWSVVIVTNQSGISRGIFDWQAYDAVTKRMLELLEMRGAIDAIYANGYGQGHGAQPWRKPNPGMLLAAARDLNLDLGRSVLVGDRLSDLIAGLNANVPTLVHVLTGHGKSEREEIVRLFPNSQHARVIGQTVIYMIEDLTQFPHTALVEETQP